MISQILQEAKYLLKIFNQHNKPLFGMLKQDQIKDNIIIVDPDTSNVYVYSINHYCWVDVTSNNITNNLIYTMECGYIMYIIPGQIPPTFCPKCSGKICIKDNGKENK